MQNKTTMMQIAKELGLSRTSVHRAINDLPGVSSKTKKQILDLVQKLDYIPNPVAQNLVNRKSGVICIVVDDVETTSWSILLKNLVNEIYANSYAIDLHISNETTSMSLAKTVINKALNGSIDALIIQSVKIFNSETDLGEIINKIRRKGVALVFLTPVPDYNEANFITTNRYIGMFQIVRHLVNLGHNSIAFVSPIYNTDINLYFDRLSGYKRALTENLEKPLPELIINTGKSGKYGDGYKAGIQIAHLEQRPTAICCSNDDIAIGMLKAFGELGIRVPEDIAITGFDGTEQTAYASVPITTVKQPLEEISKETVRFILEFIKEPTITCRNIYILPQLIIRESCGFHLKKEYGTGN